MLLQIMYVLASDLGISSGSSSVTTGGNKGLTAACHDSAYLLFRPMVIGINVVMMVLNHLFSDLNS